MKFKKLLSVGLLVLSGMTAISQPSYALFKKNGDNKLVQLKGSDTILSLSQSVAEEFMKVNKKSKISVTGGGSGTGIAAKLNKTIDIALASREMKDAEWAKAKSAGLNLQEITVAYDGITIITNKSNPVKNLTTAQLRDIFMGNKKTGKILVEQMRRL
jgi:phosphate transport system substrate-binding protein